jgi:hypothetical protein
MAAFATVYVNTLDAQRLITAVEIAVSPPSLTYFLQNDALDYFQKEIENRFNYEGDRSSGRWDSLKDATEDIRQREGYGPAHPINVRTGAMKEFVTSAFGLSVYGTGAELRIPGEMNNPMMEEKVRTAQKGKPGNRIPAFGATPERPILAVGEHDMVTMVYQLQLHIMRRVTGGIAV